MPQVIGVKFKNNDKTYYFNPCGVKVKVDQMVIVQTPQGKKIGRVVLDNRQLSKTTPSGELKPLLRIAEPKDIERMEQLKLKEKKAFKIFNNKIRKMNLDMKLVDVEYTFDGSKIIFYFTSDERIDFRSLVRELASTFKTRVELKQVGVRDETRLIGGVGNCGKSICCSTFLKEFQPVTIKMAKDQGLALNPVKISGACGRLMCCLNYEQDLYSELLEKAPQIGEKVKTPDGPGTVQNIELLQGTVKVQLDSNKAAPAVTFKMKDIIFLKEKNND